MKTGEASVFWVGPKEGRANQELLKTAPSVPTAWRSWAKMADPA